MEKRYNIDFLREKSEKLLISKGITETNAKVFVDTMISADIYGVSTHGIRMLPAYIQKIEHNEFSFSPPSIIKQIGSVSIIDAKNNIGAISAVYCTEIAVEKARREGVHMVLSRNANTFGPAFYYAEKISNAGMIGFVCCNTPAAMTAFNGLEAILGTNPIAFAAPTKSYGNIVIDMATSVVAKSKFVSAKAKGEKLQQGWALDINGNPTIDPDEGINGFVLPMAGFKGYGIALMIDMMSGLLSGASYLNNVGKFYSKNNSCMDVGHMIVAINPEIIFEEDFLSATDGYIKKIKHSKAIEGKNIVIPGEDRKKNKEIAIEYGIELTPDIVVILEKLFGELLK